MRKYQIAMIVLMAIVLAASGFGLFQAFSERQDNITERRAREIAKELNEYIDDESDVPESFEEAGIEDVPSTITYKRLSSIRYEFCVTYEKASPGYDGGGFGGVLTGSALESASTEDRMAPYYGEDNYESSKLYLYGGHKAGQNCTKVRPRLTSNQNNSLFNFESDSGALRSDER